MVEGTCITLTINYTTWGNIFDRDNVYNHCLWFMDDVFHRWIMESPWYFSGQGWYSLLEGFDGVRNTRASLSPLHTELKAFIWALESMKNLWQFHVTFATYCSQMVKMVYEPAEWPTYESYLEDIWIPRESFNHSMIIHVPRTKNTRVNSLAHSTWRQTSFVVHMDAELPSWFAES